MMSVLACHHLPLLPIDRFHLRSIWNYQRLLCMQLKWFPVEKSASMVSCQLTNRKMTTSQLLQLASSLCLHLTDWALHFLSDCVWLPFTLSLFSLFFCLSWWCLTLINTTTTTTINWIDAPLWVPVICIYLIRLFNHTRTGHCVLCQGKSRSNCMPLHLLCVLNRFTSLSGAVFLK